MSAVLQGLYSRDKNSWIKTWGKDSMGEFFRIGTGG